MDRRRLASRSGRGRRVAPRREWIWFPEPGADLKHKAPPGDRFFRRHVAVPSGAKPDYAWLTLAADACFTLYVNGKEVARVDDELTWRQPRRFDLRPLLTAGDNVVAVMATLRSDVGGLCAKLSLCYPGKEPEVVTSDRQWKAADGKIEGWTAVGFDDSHWKAAAEIAPMGEKPWRSDTVRVPSRSPILRKAVTLADKPIAAARLYVTALGLYELRLNGRRVGDHVLAPDWTDYHRRVRYQVYDVGELLRPGENALAALLGNGWYCGHVGNGAFQVWGKQPALLAQLEVTYRDGSTQRIVTDPSCASRPARSSPPISCWANRMTPGGSCPAGTSPAWTPPRGRRPCCATRRGPNWMVRWWSRSASPANSAPRRSAIPGRVAGFSTSARTWWA